MLKVDVYFQLWTRRTRKVQEKVHPRYTFSGPMPGQIAFDFLSSAKRVKNRESKIARGWRYSQQSNLYCAVFPRKPPNFVILPAAHKQEFPRRPVPWPFIWNSWTMVFSPDMPILHCMSSRWGIYPEEAFHRWFFFRASSSIQSGVDLSCIFLDSNL